jgi:hypothetical protein
MVGLVISNVGPTFMVGRELLMVLVGALLLLATGGATHAPPTDPRSAAMQSMRFLIGSWQCHTHIVGDSDYDYSMTIRNALGGSWMKADLEALRFAHAATLREEFYWTYVPLNESWKLNTFDSGGNYGDFSAAWRKDSSIDWHGRRVILGHTEDRVIKWTEDDSRRFESREYDSDVDGHLTLMSSATCRKVR